MIENEFYVIAFDSTHLAIKTEKFLKSEVVIDMIPTPREISASCGLSVKFNIENQIKVLEVLKDTEKEGMYLYKLSKEESSLRVAVACSWEE